MRLIDADMVFNGQTILVKDEKDIMTVKRMRKFVDDAPTVDAVPVVRCKDCKYCKIIIDGAVECSLDRPEIGRVARWEKDSFCSYGELKHETD